MLGAINIIAFVGVDGESACGIFHEACLEALVIDGRVENCGRWNGSMFQCECWICIE
jgi:hypothetical protein